MPKPYEAKTINEFGGLRAPESLVTNHTTYSNADLKDNEGSIVKNFVFNGTGGLVKRRGAATKNAAVAPATSLPGGYALSVPDGIRIIGIQWKVSIDNLWFTDGNRWNLYWTVLPDCLSALCRIVRTPTGQDITNVHYMANISTPTFPNRYLMCRSSGGAVTVDTNGIASAFLTTPYGTHMTVFKNRVFMINSLGLSVGANAESKLYYSEPGDFTNWPVNNFNIVGGQNGDYMVSTIVFNDSLIIFKSHSTWVLTAEGDVSAWSYRILHPTIGCAGRETPVIIGGMIYFLGNDAVYRTDGTSFEKISGPINRLLDYYVSSTTMILYRKAWYFDNKYILKPWSASAYNLYVYDIDREAWTAWDFAPSVTLEGAVPYVDALDPYFFIGDQSDSRIYAITASSNGSWQDNGENYECTWLSKRQTWDDPVNYKRNYMFTIDCGATGGAPGTYGTVSIEHKTDASNQTPPYGGTVIPITPPGESGDPSTAYRKELKLPGAGYGRAIETMIEYTGAGGFEMFSVSWLNATKELIKKSN